MSRGTFVWVTLIAAMAVATAVAQTLATQVSGAGTFISPQSNAVTGQPYSAQEETQTVQTLADGTHITNGTQKVMHYRDSLGRTRTERTPAPPPGVLATSAQAPPVFIEIADPVSGYRYSFDSINHTAHRSPFSPARIGKAQTTPMQAVATAANPFFSGRVVAAASQIQVNGVNVQRPRPDISHEQLGTRTIEGVLAEGTRTTTTYPIGFFGNDRPLTTVSEMWTSRDLGMPVLTTTSDPRRGEVTMKLTNISRAEPDASLFQPPAGYEIVDPPGQPAGK